MPCEDEQYSGSIIGVLLKNFNRQVDRCGGFLCTRRAFPVGDLHVGKRRQGRVNPEETCLPEYNGQHVLWKTSVFLGPRALGR